MAPDKAAVAITVLVAVVVISTGWVVATEQAQQLEETDFEDVGTYPDHPYENLKWYELPSVRLLITLAAVIPIAVVISGAMRLYGDVLSEGDDG
jgi:hypothetical protein